MRGTLATVAACGWLAAGCLESPPTGGPVGPADAAARDGDPGDELPRFGLVAHYPLDEVTGDSSPEALGRFDARCDLDCPTTVLGVHGKGLVFSPGRHLLVADVPELRLKSGTVAVWVRGDDLGTYAGLVVKPIGSMAAKSWEIYLDDGDRPLFQSRLADVARAPDPLRRATWTHLAATWDASSRELYVGGVPVADAAASGSPDYDANEMAIGTGIDAMAPVNPFRGALDDLRIYERVLDPGEITLLATPP